MSGFTQEQKEAYWESQVAERRRCHQNVYAWVHAHTTDNPDKRDEFKKKTDERYKTVNWQGVDRMKKQMMVFQYAQLHGCPYLQGGWYAENYDKGPEWMADNAHSRPKPYYENGYRKYRVSREEVYKIFKQ
jgi:hypothetical protein